jgi:hypothetical protein
MVKNQLHTVITQYKVQAQINNISNYVNILHC